MSSLKPIENRGSSCATSTTNCSSNSSCYFNKKKPVNPLAHRPMYKATQPVNVKQRVGSAKLLKLRQLQSQLNDANYHLAELVRENQTLLTLQKRQEKALARYENSNADLPKLIHSHEEEVRVLTDRNKSLKKTLRDVSERLKLREDELLRTKEELTHLDRLNKDKHLTDREKMMQITEDLKSQLRRYEDQVNNLNRKLFLEEKASKQRLNAEHLKHKQCQKELMHAFAEIDRLTSLIEMKETRKLNIKTSSSTTKLIKGDKSTSAPVTEVKLEPLKIPVQDNENGAFKSPQESINQRLSNGCIDEIKLETKSRPHSSVKLEKLEKIKTKMKEDDEKDVKKMVQNLDNAIQKATKNSVEILDQNLHVLDTVKNCDNAIEIQKSSLKLMQCDTETLRDTFQKTEIIEKQLTTSLYMDGEDMNYINEILNAEHKFQTDHKLTSSAVSRENKEKLLATLRAIDNGDSFDNNDTKMMENLFGSMKTNHLN